MKFIFRISVLFLFSVTNLSAQRHEADSLKIVLANAKQDTDKINTLLQLGKVLRYNSPDSSLLLDNQALQIALKDKYGKGIVDALSNIGVVYDMKGDLKNALIFEDSALAFSNKYNYKNQLNSIYNELGNITSDQNDYSTGLSYYFKALSVDSLNGNMMTAALCNNIGLNYQELGNYLSAEKYYLITEKIYEKTNNTADMASVYCNLGNLYFLQNNYKKGLENNSKALKIDSARENLLGLISDYQNVGLGYLYLGNYAKALNYTYKGIALSAKTKEFGNLQKALLNIADIYMHVYEFDSANTAFSFDIGAKHMYIPYGLLLDSALASTQKAMQYANAANDKLSLMGADRYIGDIFVYRKEYKKAILCYMRAYNMADSVGVLEEQMEYSEVLGHAYEKAGDYRSAVKYLDKFVILKDSVFGIKKSKQLSDMEAQYQTDKKDNEILLLNKERENEHMIAAEKSRRQNEIIISIILILILLLSFGFFIYRSLNKTRAQNRTIEAQKGKVDRAYEQLDAKNKEVLSSITYAKRLQDAILPPLSVIRKYLPESFVLYKPKDIVAGDFYWMWIAPLNPPEMGTTGSGSPPLEGGEAILVAAADCTGHGVPGAMVSVICSNALNRAVKEFHITEPGRILDKVRELVLETFEKSESDVKDGMDISLCTINIKTKEVQWSGANNPLWYIQNNVLKEISPDKQPIGKQENPKPFNTATLKLQKGDSLYLFTDGYADQFGGPRGKKFKYKQMQEKLLAMAMMTMDKQKEMLDSTIEDWKSGLDQVDDMLVIGITL